MKIFSRKNLYEHFKLVIRVPDNPGLFYDKYIMFVSRTLNLGPDVLSVGVSPFVTVPKVLPYTEKMIIGLLNTHYGLECLIKKGEVPIDVYYKIKGRNRIEKV